MTKSIKKVPLTKVATRVEGDEILKDLLKARDKKNAKFVSHKDAWVVKVIELSRK